MFRACVASSSRASIASSSRSAFIHTTSTVRAENPRTRLARTLKKANIEQKEDRLEKEIQNRPSPVLGTHPGDHKTWQDCELKTILVDESEIAGDVTFKAVETPFGVVKMPPSLNYGITGEDKLRLLHDLPCLSAETDLLQLEGFSDAERKSFSVHAAHREAWKANIFVKAIDLRNANAGGIAFENRRRIIAAFSDPEGNRWDPGRAEVQAALLTYKIRNLWSHLTHFKRDVGNRRNLRKLVHQRAKVLKHIKKTSRDRYDVILQRLALEPESVEGELVV
ncbi:hypothetical protein HGRIS_008614 [Hohenbuehelia grisea]|uniref:Uncharacterized protein n=1 Tax=Hohenbuehelia grisea TaxID=104357 RepID=A0ABR3J8F6_9AGAR